MHGFRFACRANQFASHAFASHRLDGGTFIVGESIERYSTDLPNNWK